MHEVSRGRHKTREIVETLRAVRGGEDRPLRPLLEDACRRGFPAPDEVFGVFWTTARASELSVVVFELLVVSGEVSVGGTKGEKPV